MSGQLFAGRYRILRRLAQGGMGVVFVAEHAATEAQVALKVLWPHVLGSKSAARSFELEARLSARIESEHVVRVLDAGVDESGVPFFVMELLRGATLRALVEEAGPLEPAEALAVLRQAARALDKAHGHVDREGRPAPIVHRDLKPENVFVALREGGDAVVKVLDFGLAKVLSGGQASSHEIKGTPAFMACEQFAQGPLTPQLDVWAFGLIAFYLLAGRAYWRSNTRNVPEFTPLLNEILLQPLEPPTERARALGLPAPWPAGFDGWFLRCLEREPSARFASAGAAVEALTEIFVAGGVLTEAAIVAAPSQLARTIALVLESAPKAQAPAEATLPEESSVDPLEATSLLGSALLGTPPASSPEPTAGEASASASQISSPDLAGPRGASAGASSPARPLPQGASAGASSPARLLPQGASAGASSPARLLPQGASAGALVWRGGAMASVAVAFAVVGLLALREGTPRDEGDVSASAPSSGVSAQATLNPLFSLGRAPSEPGPGVPSVSSPAEPAPSELRASAAAEPAPSELRASTTRRAPGAMGTPAPAEPAPHVVRVSASPEPPAGALRISALPELPPGVLRVSAPAEGGERRAAPPRQPLRSPQAPGNVPPTEQAPNAEHARDGAPEPGPRPVAPGPSRDPRGSTWVPPLPSNGG
ncbi:MAG TPA: protein kinase [Polyangiaceae bacterium]|nr:protein kinase [Polyangiaceae bacterium]